MTISRRERRVLDAVEGELACDSTLARLARLLTGPVTTPPDVWLGAGRRPRARPTPLFVILILGVAFGTAGVVLGAVLSIPLLGGASLVVLLTTAIVFLTKPAIRVRRRRMNAKTLPVRRKDSTGP